jgi:DNA-binding transcriptional ArsR family regulator
MGEYIETVLDATFHALAHPTRRAILAHLADGEMTVLELAAHHTISLNSVSKHLKVLEQAGLVRRRVVGRTHHCALSAEPLHAAEDWIRPYRRFWSERLDALERYLDRQPPPEANTGESA